MLNIAVESVKPNLADAIALVTGQIDHFRRLAHRHSPSGLQPDENRHKFYAGLITRHENLLSLLQSRDEPFKATEKKLFSGYDDLPDELVAQLMSAPQRDELGSAITQTIKDAGGAANLDTILIGLYRRTGQVFERRYINNKLFRMARRDKTVVSIPHKKGVYALSDKQEADRLL